MTHSRSTDQSVYAKCTNCNKRWNVSRYQTISVTGYLCPRCTKKCSKNRATYLLLTLIGIIIYIVFAKFSFDHRGYFAFGGETAFLLLPLWWWLSGVVVKDIKREFKSGRKREQA